MVTTISATQSSRTSAVLRILKNETNSATYQCCAMLFACCEIQITKLSWIFSSKVAVFVWCVREDCRHKFELLFLNIAHRYRFNFVTNGIDFRSVYKLSGRFLVGGMSWVDMAWNDFIGHICLMRPWSRQEPNVLCTVICTMLGNIAILTSIQHHTTVWQANDQMSLFLISET